MISSRDVSDVAAVDVVAGGTARRSEYGVALGEQNGDALPVLSGIGARRPQGITKRRDT